MSVTNKVVQLLSTKYGFEFNEALEYVKTQQAAVKNLSKEEKAALRDAEKAEKKAIKEAEKAAKAAAKEEAKAAKAAAKAEKESKPKKPRTPAQIAAFEKMKAKGEEARKLKALQKAAAASGENVVLETSQDIVLVTSDEPVKKEKKEKKTKKVVDEVPLETPVETPVEAVVDAVVDAVVVVSSEEPVKEKKVKKEKKEKKEKKVEVSSDDKMLDVFDNL
jgi:hypothetical protein